MPSLRGRGPARTSEVNVTLDFPRETAQVFIHLNEADTQAVAGSLRRGESVTAVLVLLRRVYVAALRSMLSGNARRHVKLIHEAENESALGAIGEAVLAKLADKLIDWVGYRAVGVLHAARAGVHGGRRQPRRRRHDHSGGAARCFAEGAAPGVEGRCRRRRSGTGTGVAHPGRCLAHHRRGVPVVMDEATALRFQLTSEIAHWRTAVAGLTDVENFASAQAWRAVEAYLGLAIRRHLSELVRSVVAELDAVEADLRATRTLADVTRVRGRLHRFRRRYLQAETVLEFYGHAIRSRTTTRLGELLCACDVLARQSMMAPLRLLGVCAPPVLVYLDRGFGASILRANLRLWDGGGLSPAAAIKLTRFNLFRPTSMLHEAGHQVAHLTGWNEELPVALRRGVPDAAVAELWAGWATELGPDFLAFAHAGYGAVAALHDVVAGEATQVFAW